MLQTGANNIFCWSGAYNKCDRVEKINKKMVDSEFRNGWQDSDDHWHL